MDTIATATTHPALVMRNAVDAVTTELVRADIAPTFLTVTQYPSSGTVGVSMNLSSRADFDSARSLFGFGDDLLDYTGPSGVSMVGGTGSILGLTVRACGPAYVGHRFDTITMENGPECSDCGAWRHSAVKGGPCGANDRDRLPSDEIPADCDAASLS